MPTMYCMLCTLHVVQITILLVSTMLQLVLKDIDNGIMNWGDDICNENISQCLGCLESIVLSLSSAVG